MDDELERDDERDRLTSGLGLGGESIYTDSAAGGSYDRGRSS